MARYANPLVMDAALDYIADVDLLCVCSTQPTTYAQAVVTYMLSTVAINSGSFVKSSGSAGGRRTTIGAVSGSCSNSGSAQHMAVVKTSGSILKYVWVLTSQYLTAGNPITTPSLYGEISDPTA
jgi:hypothetical protein